MRQLRFSLLVALVFQFFVMAEGSLAQTSSDAEVLPVDALIQALEDPEARAQLIEALRTLGGQDAEEETSDGVPSRTLATVAAEVSQRVVSELSGSAIRVYNDLARFALLPDLLTTERRATIRENLFPLLLTVLVTVLVFRTARFFTGRIRFDGQSEESTFLNRTVAFLGQVFLRLLAVLIAWVSGYIFASFILNSGQPALSQALYLNAFVIFGLVTTALSVFASNDPRDMTFARMEPRTERVIYTSVRRVFGFLIYGLVAAAPISQIWVNFVAARSMRTLVVTLGAIAALYAIARIKRAISLEHDGQETKDEAADSPERGRLWQAAWPWLAVLYVFISYGLALANPNTMVELVGRATILTAASLCVFLIALRCFGQARQETRVVLPPAFAKLFPPLEERLSGFMPMGLMAAGCVLVIIAGGFFVEAWHFLDVSGWLTSGGSDLVWRVVYIAIGIVVLVIGWSVLTAWIDTRLSEELSGKQVSSRSRTLLALFKNVVSIALVIFGGMTVLSEIGVDIAPLLAGAGVLGLAIGFGAQKLVQDIITGIFIQLENAINEGDVVTVAGITGGVEKLTIRSVALRDLAGTYHLIPFSSVDTVGNFMRRFAFHVEIAGISYDSDVEAAKEAMHRAYDTVKSGLLGKEIIAPLEWHGVVSLGDSSVNLRARIKTKPGQQWPVGRAYTQEVKRELDASGVEIPFPHRELKMPKELFSYLSLPNQKAAE